MNPTPEQYSVRLMKPVDDLAERAGMAAKAAARLGTTPDKVEKLVSRKPGFITKPSSQSEAQRAATIFSQAGFVVEVVRVNAPEAAPAPASSRPPAPATTPEANPLPRPPMRPEPSDDVSRNSARAASLPPLPPINPYSTDPNMKLKDVPVLPPRPDTSPLARPDTSPLARPDTSPLPAARFEPAPPIPRAEPMSPPEARSEAAPRVVITETEDDADERNPSSTSVEKPRRRRRFSLRWKLLLASLLPLLVLAGVTIFIARSTVNDTATRLLTGVADNVAQVFALDLSNYLTETGVGITDQDAILYLTRRFRALQPGLHDIVGIHYTDASGQRINGIWESDITQNPDFPRFEQGFGLAAQNALASLPFAAAEAERRATLDTRTVRIAGRLGTFYTVATPLANNAGTMQAVITERNITQTADRVIRPIILASLAALAIAILIVFIVAFALTRNIRRLASEAERIALGDLEEPIQVSGNDETRDLAEAFESMRLSLKAAIERLSKRERAARKGRRT